MNSEMKAVGAISSSEAAVGMTIAMIQISVTQSIMENLASVLLGLDQAKEADLAVLPELWNTPFDNRSILAHSHEWEILISALQKKAREHGLWIVSGSLPCFENGQLYNRAAIINPEGKIIAHADKLHLLEVHTRHHHYKEADVFTGGNTLCTFDSPWGKIAVCICMDVRFPELCRLLCEDCFLLVVCAGFNAAVGTKHWLPLLQARAIENQVFVCGVNPAPCHYDGYDSYGHSCLISPDGQVLGMMDQNGHSVRTMAIQPDLVDSIRTRSPYWSLRRQDLYSLKPVKKIEK